MAKHTDRRRTPVWLLEAVRAYAGGPIALDPCTEPDNPTGAQVALTDECPNGWVWETWFAHAGDPVNAAGWIPLLWMNPPFSELLRWVVAVIDFGPTSMALTPVDMSTRYWRQLSDHAVARCDLSKRLRCLGPDKHGVWRKHEVARSASVWLVSGDLTRFATCFGHLGQVVPLDVVRALTALGKSKSVPADGAEVAPAGGGDDAATPCAVEGRPPFGPPAASSSPVAASFSDGGES